MLRMVYPSRKDFGNHYQWVVRCCACVPMPTGEGEGVASGGCVAMVTGDLQAEGIVMVRRLPPACDA